MSRQRPFSSNYMAKTSIFISIFPQSRIVHRRQENIRAIPFNDKSHSPEIS
jgi:hypothetical protein